jgi:hypothetical protein
MNLKKLVIFIRVTNRLTESFCVIEGYDRVLLTVSVQDLEKWTACKLGKRL